MENIEGGVVPVDEKSCAEGAVQENTAPCDEQAGAGEPATETTPQLSAEELQRLPPELRPGPDGKPPKITPRLLKSMRGHYFTIRHILLAECGHKLDVINQPKNNCPECWWTWFRTHPQLMETADQFYRTQGRGPLIGMRGLKFVKMFERTMATLYHMQREEAALKAQEKTNEPNSQGQSAGTNPGVEASDAVAGAPPVIEG